LSEMAIFSLIGQDFEDSNGPAVQAEGGMTVEPN